MQHLHNIGPIPRGRYIIGPPHNTETRGPYVLALTPDPDNEMYGRSAFLIHGDSKSSPGNASQGCIILPRTIRQMVWESGEKALIVV